MVSVFIAVRCLIKHLPEPTGSWCVAKRIVLVTIFGNFSAVISGVLAFAFNGVTTGGLSGWKW
jgi:hypothetical protein